MWMGKKFFLCFCEVFIVASGSVGWWCGDVRRATESQLKVLTQFFECLNNCGWCKWGSEKIISVERVVTQKLTSVSYILQSLKFSSWFMKKSINIDIESAREHMIRFHVWVENIMNFSTTLNMISLSVIPLLLSYNRLLSNGLLVPHFLCGRLSSWFSFW